MSFMVRVLSKEIITRMRFRNNFLKDKTEENKRKYSKQSDYCVSLLRKSKLEYFGNLNEKESATTWYSGTPFNSENNINRERRDYYGRR